MPTKDWITNYTYHTNNWLAVVWNIRPGVLHRKWGMLVLDVFKGHLTPEMKATISSINTDLAVTLAGITLQLEVLKCCGEEVKRPSRAAIWRVAAGRELCFDPSWTNQEARCDSSLSMDCNGMAAHLTGCDCKGIQRVLCISGWMG
jgi:hypothetical protein